MQTPKTTITDENGAVSRGTGLRFRKSYPDGIQVVYDLVSNRKKGLDLKTDVQNKKKSASTLLLQKAGATTPTDGVTTPKARGSQTSTVSIADKSAESNYKQKQMLSTQTNGNEAEAARDALRQKKDTKAESAGA